MTMDIVLVGVWALMNSPVGVSVVASIALWMVNKVYAAKPEWQAYEGALIQAVRWAEKEIPDEADNKYLRKADLALQYALKAYERMNGYRAGDRMREQLAQGVEVVHADLEAAGVLGFNRLIAEG